MTLVACTTVVFSEFIGSARQDIPVPAPSDGGNVPSQQFPRSLTLVSYLQLERLDPLVLNHALRRTDSGGPSRTASRNARDDTVRYTPTTSLLDITYRNRHLPFLTIPAPFIVRHPHG